MKKKSEAPNQLMQIAQTVILNYSGDISVLNSALGMLFTGHYYGWRFLYIVHSKRTVRKYEKVLNIKVKLFQPTGPLSHRSAGWLKQTSIQTSGSVSAAILRSPTEN